MLLKHLRYNSWWHSFLRTRVHIYIIGFSQTNIDANMDSCIHATSFLLWVSMLKYTITVVWVLVIQVLMTLGRQRFSQILEENLDTISSMWVHWDTWDNSRGHHAIGVVLGNVFVQILFPKHCDLFTPRKPYSHIRTGFWRFWIFENVRGTTVWKCSCDKGLTSFFISFFGFEDPT